MRRLTDRTPDQDFPAGARAAYGTIGKSGNNLTDGVLTGFGWRGDQITFSFPDSPDDYGYDTETSRNFSGVTNDVQNAVRVVMDRDAGNAADDGFALEGFTKLVVSERVGDDDAKGVIRYAESSEANPSAYAYYPNGNEKGGDIWLGREGDESLYGDADIGTYNYATVLHETGHALGLKHGHEATKNDDIKTVLSDRYDSLEYSVMTYHSYVGSNQDNYTNEDYGYPQSFMMADISALQYMYGANFKVNGGATVYSWSPDSSETHIDGGAALTPAGSNIFATIWDGGGHDEYDLSDYSESVTIDLRPGRSSLFSQSQLADLDSESDGRLASGNIYNALLYEKKGVKDLRSLIEDATGGAGNDRLTGNVANNTLTGNAGDDTFAFARNSNCDTITDFGQGADVIDLSSFDIRNFTKLEGMMSEVQDGVIVDFGKGDMLILTGAAITDLTADDFIL